MHTRKSKSKMDYSKTKKAYAKRKPAMKKTKNQKGSYH